MLMYTSVSESVCICLSPCQHACMRSPTRRLFFLDWAPLKYRNMNYLSRASAEEADRVEITWLKQLRTPERVDVSELFLRSAYVRYGGHFLPYMEPSPVWEWGQRS